MYTNSGMSIRYKYLVLFPITALLPVLIFYYVTSQYITSGLAAIQQGRLIRELESVKLAILSGLGDMRSEADNFSRWDELYSAAGAQLTPRAIEEINERLASAGQRFNFAAFDQSGNLIYRSGEWQDTDANRIAAKHRQENSRDAVGSSIEQISGGLWVIGSAQLTHLQNETPRGLILVGRTVEDVLAGRPESAARLPFVIYSGTIPVASGRQVISAKPLEQEDWRRFFTSFVEGTAHIFEQGRTEFASAVYAPILSGEERVYGIIKIEAPEDDLVEVKSILDRTSILIFMLVGLAAVAAAFIFSFYIVNRITTLNTAITNLLSGEPVTGIMPRKFMRDEIDQLLASFVKMKGELESYLSQLIASEVKYKRVVNSSISGIFVYSGGSYQFCNPQFEAITGYSLSELNGLDSLEYIHPDDREKFVENVVYKLGGKWQARMDDTRIITKRGEDKVLSIRTEKIDYQGEPALLGHVIDVTSQRELERQLFHTQKLESIGTLAGGIAHDFNNVIGGIIGFAEMLEERKRDDERQKEILERILKLGRRGSRLVKQLLTFARGSKSAMEVIDVKESIERVLEIFILPRHLNINLEVAFPEFPLYIVFSPIEFDQMMVNLLVNARDALPEGGSIRVYGDKVQTGEGGFVDISVSDTGTGISPQNISRIFDPFFTTKEVGKGTGLGLAVVYGIVESHSGTIAVRSEAGEGTTFTMRFPEVSPEDAAPGVQKPAEEAGKSV